MLPFKLFHNSGAIQLPISLYSCGLHPQHAIYRPVGYPTLQVMICFAGGGTFHCENKPYIKLTKGSLLIIPSKVSHDYTPSGNETWLMGYIGIDGEFADSLIHSLQLPILQPITVDTIQLERLEQVIHKLWHINVSGEADDVARRASIIVYDGLTYIASIIKKESDVQLQRKYLGAKELLLEAVQYMEQHYMDKVSVSNIAHTVGYTQQHFQRVFKELYGVSPNQYLQHLRLLKGAQYLEEEEELTVGEIAAMVGMELNYFVRMFKREYNMSPAKYRSMLRESRRK